MNGEYTKDELVAQVLDGVENPQNLNNAVKRYYVAKYLAAAINFVFTNQYYADLSNEELDGLSEVEDLFVAPYIVPVSWDKVLEQYYIELPATPMNLPHGKGIKYIGPVVGQQNAYKPIGQNMLATMGRSLPMSTKRFYMPGKDRYALFNHPFNVKELLIKMVVSVSGLKGADKVPMPPGRDLEVINMAREWFLGKRALPETTVNNNKDEPKQA